MIRYFKKLQLLPQGIPFIVNPVASRVLNKANSVVNRKIRDGETVGLDPEINLLTILSMPLLLGCPYLKRRDYEQAEQALTKSVR